MKQKLLLALLALLTLGGSNLYAQTWTASEVGTGDFVLYNVGAGQYFTKGNNWGTRASITADASAGSALQLIIEVISEGKYKLRTNVNGDGNGVENLDGGTIYTDQSREKNSTWTFTQVSTDNGPVYNIISADNHSGGSGAYMTASADNTIVGPGADGTSAYAQWKLLEAAKVPLVAVLAEYQAIRTTVVGWTTSSAVTNAEAATTTFNTALAAADDKVANATTEAEINEAIADLKAAGNTFLENVIITGGLDITNAWITNPAPGISGNTNGWINSGSPGVANQLFEYWNVAGGSTKQTLSNLPKGAYQLTAIAYTRDNMSSTLYAGDNTINLVGCGSVNDRTQGDAWIAQGNGVNNLAFTLDQATASLEIGLIADNTTGDHWMCWRSFSLTYYGDPINLAKAALAEAVANAEALEGTIPSGVYASLAAVVAEKNQAYQTIAEYEAATADIVEATNNAKVLQAPYSRYTTIKAAALAISSNVDTSIADDEVADATNTAAIDAAIATLRAAFLAELPNVTVPSNPGYVDVTDVMVDNASVSTNVDYWTVEKTSGNGPTTNYGETEFYNANFKFYQTLALTPGTWEFGVTGFHRGGQGDYSTYFYAGEDKILIPGVTSDVVNTMAQAKTYFDNGNGKVALKFLIETAQNVEIGINNQDTQTDKWTIFRDFTLKYYGAPDYSVYDQQWANAVAAANAAITANPNVTGEELDAVQAAIADAPDGSSKANYLEKIDALVAATQAFTAAAPAYNAYVAEKAIAEMIGVEPGEDPTTAAAAAAGVNTLKVAEFNYVDEQYPYDYEPVIGTFGEWTATATVAGQPATPNYLDYEHWSGTTHAYYEQAANGWGSTTGWTVKYEKTAKLPAGDYMLKVAARSSEGTTSLVSCTATENTVTLPANGARTRGINTSGVASWSDSDTFAAYNSANEVIPTVGGTGLGWEWRYLPFSLTEPTEVTMTFEASATTQYQWMSIADGTLLSKQEIQNVVEIASTDEAAPEAQVATSVNTDRKLLDGLNTVVFPFETTAEELGATTVLEYSGTTVETDGLTLNFKEVAAVDDVVTLQANTPYAVFVEGDQDENLTFGTKNIAPADDLTVDDTNNEFNFVGTYKDLVKGNDVVVNGDYVAGAQAFKKAKGGNRIAAYRAYLKNVGNSDGAKIAFNFDGNVVDGIEAIELLNKLSIDGTYNLQGQKVNRAQKGVYIVNGKKVVIK